MSPDFAANIVNPLLVALRMSPDFAAIIRSAKSCYKKKFFKIQHRSANVS